MVLAARTRCNICSTSSGLISLNRCVCGRLLLSCNSSFPFTVRANKTPIVSFSHTRSLANSQTATKVVSRTHTFSRTHTRSHALANSHTLNTLSRTHTQVPGSLANSHTFSRTQTHTQPRNSRCPTPPMCQNSSVILTFFPPSLPPHFLQTGMVQSPHVINAVMECIEAMRVSLGPTRVLQHTLQVCHCVAACCGVLQ